MPARRLLTSLAAHPPTKPSTRLIAPYTHTLTSIPSSLRPPYTHTLPQENDGHAHRSTLNPRVKFEIVHLEGQAQGQGAKSVDAWQEWANGVLATEQGRQEVEKVWKETIAELENIKSSGNQIPQIPFHSLSSHLGKSSTIEAIKATGSVVVRDVVPDADAVDWAKETLLAITEAGGRSLFWHPSLVAARSNPSVLSALSQLSSALLSTSSYITADTLREGIQPRRTEPHFTSPWLSSRSLLSHLALSPPLSELTVSRLPPTIHAATYALLRPLFRPIKSKISFYHASAYLDPANWVLGLHEGESDLPHIAGTEVEMPSLSPGDMIFHHTAIPISQTQGQVFLPVHPVPKGGNEVWAAGQRESFERGLPPVETRVEGELAVVEEAGRREMIGSRAGREALGYE
ncbi:hypothetical protein CI109_101397 [Kwoniella shandongensis]|uniref:Uncharacterized protein n=1 Tax=Kwoniella shandongensis TaxID=1734106 RepID=A0A5M6BX92_9TREE|nr:uncharacterized protein CI109_005094 [Kwoniella shandongensis]KAA5526522.1 hypothetical protein CI109_005094 [Kwoniella shandongensis]